MGTAVEGVVVEGEFWEVGEGEVSVALSVVCCRESCKRDLHMPGRNMVGKCLGIRHCLIGSTTVEVTGWSALVCDAL